MKKITLFISALALIATSSVAQNTRTLGPVAKPTGASQSQLLQMEQQMMTASEKTPDGKIRCFTHQADQLLKAKHPDLGTTEEFEQWIAPKIEEWKKNGWMHGNKVVMTIPVIVHVVHNGDAVGSGENISAAQVQSQIDVLNEDFRKIAGSRGDGNGVDCELEFCMATEDPSGTPLAEPGIHRYNGGVASWTSTTSIDGTLKPATSWDPTRYFNMWSVRFGGSASSLLGYAQFPNNSGLSGLNTNNGAANTDGVVIGYNFFGSSDKGSFALSAPYDKGRTATHEVGHCFGLRHIWGDGGCSVDDYCNDTPASDAANYGCPTGHVSCGTTDQIENYMDYTDDACMDMFSQNQKDRMMVVMANSPRRSTLPSSTVCGTPNLTAEFTGAPTTINAGQTVTFTDASTGPNTITGWSWNFDVGGLGGVTPATASTQGPHVVTYNNAGTYTVSLQVTDNTAATDNEQKNSYIIVNTAGTQTCDSTSATWDFATHSGSTGAYYWGPDCNGTAPSGYILGQNCYGDNGWCDKIGYTGSGDFLTDVLFYFSSTGTGNVNLKVWGQTAGAPNNGNVMAQQSVAISSLATAGSPTLWTLASPPTLNGNFFVGHDHNTLVNGDSVALMSANTGTNSVWAYESTNSWVDLSTYGLTHSGAVIPVICNSVATGEKEILGDINEIMVFPNPSNGTINIALTEKTVSSVDVYNVVGKLVRSTKPLNTQLITINIDDQPNGVYFVNINTGGTVITKKVMISK